MLFENYNHKFIESSGRQIFVPTKDARIFGGQLHEKILRHWSPPDYFYHFKKGGHVAAVQAHLESQFFVHLDLARFFDTITRGRVHRALRRIGFRQREAWAAACHSTVNKSDTIKSLSLPFGFVQSPILASVALSASALGLALAKLHGKGMRLSVFMDDILLSGDDTSTLAVARHDLEGAAIVSHFSFNRLKSSGPCAGLEVFNLSLSHGRLAVSATRLAEFEAALEVADAATADGILGYVGTVNSHQRAVLAAR